MGNKGSRLSYEQYYELMKQQNGGSVRDIHMNLNGLDPYEVLGVSQNFTWNDLKNAYRERARRVHPDKGGSQEVFNLVTDCFRQLANEYKMKIETRHHHELKQDAHNYYADRPVATRSSSKDEGFSEKFNRLFDENKLKLEDDNEVGYGHVMTESSPVREDIDIPNTLQKYNKDKFNKAFEKMVPLSKEVTVYKEPEPLQLAKSIQYTELGGKTGDFSSGVEAGEKRSLQFTDYMKAHTTSRLVDPRSITQRKEYKSVEDYEAARATTLGKAVTDEEKRWLHEREERIAKMEHDRVMRLKQRDDAIAKHFDQVNRLMLR
jgi:hypothetical protein